MLFNYLILGFFVDDVKQYLVPIAIFSILVDLDHIPGILVLWAKRRNLIKEWKKLNLKDLMHIFRSPIQEPLGIIIITLFLATIYETQLYFGFDSLVLKIAIACILLHWLLDFLTVQNRPFAPYSEYTFSVFFKTKKARTINEFVVTSILAVCFLIVYF